MTIVSDNDEKTILEGSADMRPFSTPASLPKLPDLTFEAEIGRGGMGIVWRAHQPFLDRHVAVKVLTTESGHWNQMTVDRFRREAKILASLNHPHIVACYNAGASDDNQLYIVMELVSGPNLSQYLREHPPLSSLQTARLARHLASALEYAVQRDLIHRDVKAENVLLKPEERTPKDAAFPFVPKLVDLGLAKYQNNAGMPGNAITQSGIISGTPSVMAPEQFDDPDNIDHRADIYALGCVMFRALTGKNPYEGLTFTQLMHSKLAEDAKSAISLKPDVDPALDALVREMMDRNRDKRPQTYADIIARLELIAPSLSSTNARRMSTPSGVAPTPSGTAAKPAGSGLLVGMVAVGLVIAAGGAWMLWPPAKKPAADPAPAKGQAALVAAAAPSVTIDAPVAPTPAPTATPEPDASTLLWDQDGQAVWGVEAKTRLSGWIPIGDATWTGDDTLGEGVVGNGTGEIEKGVGRAPWRVIGNLRMESSTEVGIYAGLTDGRRVMLRLQDFGGSQLASLGTEDAPDAQGKRVWTPGPTASPPAAASHTFGLIVQETRVEVTLDERPLGSVEISSPATAFGLAVRGGKAVFVDASLHRPQ